MLLLSVCGDAAQAAGYCWREGDIEWTPVTTVTYPAVCSIAGLVAGMFGVGGGIVKVQHPAASLQAAHALQENILRGPAWLAHWRGG